MFRRSALHLSLILILVATSSESVAWGRGRRNRCCAAKPPCAKPCVAETCAPVACAPVACEPLACEPAPGVPVVRETQQWHQCWHKYTCTSNMLFFVKSGQHTDKPTAKNLAKSAAETACLSYCPNPANCRNDGSFFECQMFQAVVAIPIEKTLRRKAYIEPVYLATATLTCCNGWRVIAEAVAPTADEACKLAKMIANAVAEESGCRIRCQQVRVKKFCLPPPQPVATAPVEAPPPS